MLLGTHFRLHTLSFVHGILHTFARHMFFSAHVFLGAPPLGTHLLYIHFTYTRPFSLHTSFLFPHTPFLCTYTFSLHIHLFFAHTPFLCTYTFSLHMHLFFTHTPFLYTYTLSLRIHTFALHAHNLFVHTRTAPLEAPTLQVVLHFFVYTPLKFPADSLFLYFSSLKL
jgi:hypothetical protein